MAAVVQIILGEGTVGYPDDESYDGYEKRAYQGYGKIMGKRDFRFPDDEDYVGNEKRAYQGYGRKMGTAYKIHGYGGYGIWD